MDNGKEYILCAAVRRKAARDCPQVYREGHRDIYSVELGWRHCDILHRFAGELEEFEQGFFTSKGRYVDRKEAAELAYACGQIEKPAKVLFSEDIY